MSAARTAATARRVLRQLRHDPRTVMMMIVIPCVLLTLLKFVFHHSAQTFDRTGAPLLGIFALVVMFVVTSVTTLRERTSGTLERLLTMPTARLDFLLGYAAAFGIMALIQAAVAFALALGPLGLAVDGPTWLLFVFVLGSGLLGTTLGLSVSAFAATEFQAVQFLPAFVLPQLLLSGLFEPRGSMPTVLDRLSDILPLSYVVDGLARVTSSTDVSGFVVRDLAVIFGGALLALSIGTATLRRVTA